MNFNEGFVKSEFGILMIWRNVLNAVDFLWLAVVKIADGAESKQSAKGRRGNLLPERGLIKSSSVFFGRAIN